MFFHLFFDLKSVALLSFHAYWRKIYIPAVNNHLPTVDKMVSLTKNEARTLAFLVRNFSKNCNINQLAKLLKISPGGMYKLLKKLSAQGWLVSREEGNSSFYNINYNSQEALDVCKLALSEQEQTSYVKIWVKDLDGLRDKTDLAILFGSVLQKGREAQDIDLLLVLEKRNLGKVEQFIQNLNKVKPKKVHAIYQTRKDFLKNVEEHDPALLEEVRTGIILWGKDLVIEAIKNEQDKRQS